MISYPLEKIDFRPWAESVLSVERLEDLHLRPDPFPFPNYVKRLEYYAGLLKDQFDAVVDQYMGLVDVVAPLFEGLVLRQKPPSFRCHLVGGGTASAFHRDGDEKYGITPGTINAWVPLTEVGGSNSIYIETKLGSEEYLPVTAKPGEVLLFDAFHLKHGSYPNGTRSTRVSFDFRFLPNNPRLVHDLGIAAEPV